eukprot:COSAG05_NODE_12408_length_469_cov_0.710811_1_plen_59_part_10
MRTTLRQRLGSCSSYSRLQRTAVVARGGAAAVAGEGEDEELLLIDLDMQGRWSTGWTRA